jgi:hypothetical protein
MKIDQLLTEYKKGVKAIKYNKKPQPLVGPDALKKKSKIKQPPKTELEKHSNLTSKLKEADIDTISPQSSEKKKQIRQATIDYNKSPGQKSTPPSSEFKAQIRKDVKNIGQEIYKEESVKDKLYKRHQEIRKKSGLPNPDYYKELKSTYDLSDEDRHAKTVELKKKYGVKEAKRPDRPPPKTDLKVGDDVVADTSKEEYPGGHKERRGKVTRVGQQGVHIKTDDSDEPEWHPYKIVKKSVSEDSEDIEVRLDGERVPGSINDFDHARNKASKLISYQKGEVAEIYVNGKLKMRLKLNTPHQHFDDKDMKETKQPEPPKPRNFVAKNAKTAGAGKHKDAKKAAKDVRGQKHRNKELAEAEMGKIIDYKPGQTATLNTGPGMTTIVDLKKNPTSLTKDPATGKLKLVGPQAQGTPAQQSTQQSTIKAGDAVEIGKTTEDLLRLAGLRKG